MTTGWDTYDWLWMAAKLVFFLVIFLQVVPIMLFLERRGSALMQNRLGPNRIGPFGFFQTIADTVKFIFKEDYAPAHVDTFYYSLAPALSVIPSFMTFAVIPFAAPIAMGGRILNFQVADLNVGLLYIFAVASLGIYGIIMAGWSSNNKYSMLGSLRSTSQMISYELAMGLSVIGIIMAFSSVHLGDIARAQGEVLFHIGSFAVPKWGIFIQPIGFLIFFTSVFAETNRLPFDLPEGESEIVAGYHIEYGAMRFALIMMAEYNNMFTASGLLATLFFGSWHGLGWAVAPLGGALGLSGLGLEWLRVALQVSAFMIKLSFFMWVFVWVRWTLPRFRFDQVMDLGWKVMLPLALLNVVATGAMIYYGWF